MTTLRLHCIMLVSSLILCDLYRLLFLAGDCGPCPQSPDDCTLAFNLIRNHRVAHRSFNRGWRRRRSDRRGRSRFRSSRLRRRWRRSTRLGSSRFRSSCRRGRLVMMMLSMVLAVSPMVMMLRRRRGRLGGFGGGRGLGRFILCIRSRRGCSGGRRRLSLHRHLPPRCRLLRCDDRRLGQRR
jgi:hypothetical protein